MNHNPKTNAEWQEAVNAAHVMLLIEAARQYGLITGGPKANVERCDEILRLGAKLKVFPEKDAVQRMINKDPKTYVLGKERSAPWILCLHCGSRSYNANDIEKRYCGKCHKFHEDEPH